MGTGENDMKRCGSNLLKGMLIGTFLLGGTSLSAASETPITQLPLRQPARAALQSLPDAPIQIIVSRKDQRLRVFRGLEEIATSRVSTGKRGHSTPTGIFSILEKRKRHFSNIYNNAPMPYMQRLTWSGIALHQSNSVPNYPASHGCVRLPGGFAKKLFGMTERGAHVVIANRDTVPVAIDHDALFQPQDLQDQDKLSILNSLVSDAPAPSLGKISLLDERPARNDLAHQIARQLNRLHEVKESGKPLRIYITRQAKGNLVNDVQRLLNKLGFDAGEADGIAGKQTMAAVRAFLATKDGSIESRIYGNKARIDRVLLSQLYQASGEGRAPSGHLLVRHNFKPLFDAPIEIRNESQPLGTHLFTASPSVQQDGKLTWLAVNLGDKLTDRQQERYGVRQGANHDGFVDAQNVLDRLVIPEETRAHIAHLISNGASLTISDRGIGPQVTPVGTDFIVLTKPTLRKGSKAKAKLVKKKKIVKKKPKVQKVAKKATKSRPFRLFRRSSNQAAN